MQTPSDLRRVTRAAAARDSASREYREALRAARDSGATLEQLARAGGTTRQAVSQLLKRLS